MKPLLRSLPLVALVAFALIGCTESNTTDYETRGRVVALSPETNSATILHEDIPNYMESHEMAFTAAEGADLEALMVGDLVSFTVKVADDGSVVIDNIEKLPVDTQLMLEEPAPEPVMPDSTMMSDSTMVLEDTSAAM